MKRTDETVPLVENDTVKKPTVPTCWHAIFPMFLVAVSGGGLLAPHTQFYTEIFCSRYYKSQDQNSFIPTQDCAIPEVQKMVSIAQAIIMFLTYGSTLLFAGYYGRVSDLKGRRIILRISTLGTLIYVAFDLITAKYHETIGISLMFIGPIFRGVLAGEGVLMAAVQAYIADCTPPASRTIVFAWLMSSLFIGAAIGPFGSSLILKHTGSIVNVFYACLIVDFSNFIYTMFFLPESNPFALKARGGEPVEEVPERSHAVHFWEKLNVFSALKILFRDEPANMSKHALPLLALAEFLLTLVKRPPTLLYAMLKFKWTAYEGSIYYMYASLTRLFIMIGVLPLLHRIFNKKNKSEGGEEKKDRNTTVFDLWMVRIGIGIDALCLALAGLATSVSIFVLAGMLQSVSMLAQPSIRGLLTTMVKPSQVGELLGAVAILDSLAMIISHLSVNTIYSSSVDTMPSLTFYVLAVTAGLSCISSCLVRKYDSNLDEEDDLYQSLSSPSSINNDIGRSS